MPRRSKKEIRMSYEEQIQEIENKIEEHKEAISRLKKKRAAKEQADLEKLAAFVKESGKSPEEVLSILQNQE